MNFLPGSFRRQAIIRKTITGLFSVYVLISSHGAAGDPISPPTMEDALSMIEADRMEFMDILGADKGAPPANERLPAPEKPAADVPGKPASGDADPALDDFAAYALLIETDPEAPENVELLVSRAGLFTERGFYDRAIEDLLMALRLDIDNQPAWHTLGWAHEMKGEFETAREAYDEAIELGAETEVGIAAQWDRGGLELVAEDDRRKTLEELGMPDAFTLIMIASGADSHEINRHETWYYYRAGTRFEFVNGVFVEGADIEDVDFETVEAIFTPYRPYQFSPNLNFEDVADIIGEQDYVLYELGDDPLQDGELIYTRQLALGFKNGGLFYVRTFPLFTDE